MKELERKIKFWAWKCKVFLKALAVNPFFNYIKFFKITENNEGAVYLQIFGRNILEETLGICRKLNMKPFLIYGTLLGYYRDTGFIKHDFDIDLGLLETDWPKLSFLKQEMRKIGYVIRLENRYEISFIKPSLPGVFIDMWLFYKTENEIACSMIVDRDSLYSYYYPPDVLDKFKKVKFLNKIEALVPAETERFLRLSYKNWQKPNKNTDFIKNYPNVKIEKVK